MTIEVAARPGPAWWQGPVGRWTARLPAALGGEARLPEEEVTRTRKGGGQTSSVAGAMQPSTKEDTMRLIKPRTALAIATTGAVVAGTMLLGMGAAVGVSRPPADCPADWNGDGVVSTADIYEVMRRFGTKSGVGDIKRVMLDFGKVCPTKP
jgi:hypothetical protein